MIYALFCLLLTALVATGALTGLDTGIASAVPHIEIAGFLTWPFVYWSTPLWLGLIAWLLWRKQGQRSAALFLLVFFAASVAELLLKIFMDQPAGDMPHSALGVNLENTYPSGHVLRSTLVAGGLRYAGWGRWVWLLPATQAAAMLLARAHWPYDLLGGWLLGMAALSLFYLLAKQEKKCS